MSGHILIYEDKEKQVHTQVKLDGDTLWLNQKQISELFSTTSDNISLHLKNIFSERELSEDSTTEDFSVVQIEGTRKVKRKIKHYNLDVIISVGYRVNSKKGTQFRIWANKVLKDYLLQGYALDNDRLKKQNQCFEELQNTLLLFKEAQSKNLDHSEASGLLHILTEYTHSFILLNQFDSDNFPEGGLNTNITKEINLSEARQSIGKLKQQLISKDEATELFGNPKDDSFQGILGNIVQSFGGEYLYPSIEEQAAHLLYFIIKNHPFTDGNKRIGAFIFIWFLQLNKHHLKATGEVKINDNALVAIALLVAQSDPRQKETMIKLIINLIKDV